MSLMAICNNNSSLFYNFKHLYSFPVLKLAFFKKPAKNFMHKVFLLEIKNKEVQRNTL